MAEARRPVTWSPEALADLDELWNYYVGIAGRHTADKMVGEISKAVRVLEDYPFAGRSRSEVRPELRSVVAWPHVIFYRVKDNIAEIVRVLDGRQDVEEILAERG